MPETSLACPKCRGRISTFRLETGRGSGICCECTDSYDIVIDTVGDSDEVRTIDLTCRRTGKRSFHLQLHQACRFRRWLVPVGWAAMAALAVTLVVFTGVAIANVVDRGAQLADAQILTAPLGLYLLGLLSRNLTLTERVSVVGDDVLWTRTTLLRQRRRLRVYDIAGASRATGRDDGHAIRLVMRDGTPFTLGAGLSLPVGPIDWTCAQLRERLDGDGMITVSPAPASANQSHEHIWLY